jgi:glycosyltransferase involved in cell wall biosynthesis
VKVLHVITGLGVGGAELQLRSVLQHSRHEGEVVTLYNPGPVAEMIGADGVRVRDVGMSRNTQVGVLWRLRGLVRDGGYDVVHAHLYRSQVYGRPAAWLAGTPVVVSTEHSIGETHLERRKMTAGVRALYLVSGWFSQVTIAVSATVAGRMTGWGVPARKVAVIPNGVDLGRVAFDGVARDRVRAEFGAGPGEFVIGVLGRLDPNKQFQLVIEAAAPLLRAGRAKLVIVGKGEEGGRLEKVAAEHGVAGLVVFAGERHDVAGVLSAFDMFVASSAQETFGLSVLEALANGLPVAYTTCPALDGLDVARATRVPHDAAGIAVALEAAVAAGQAGRVPEPAVEREYGIAAVTARIDDLYEQIAARPGPRRRAARLARRTRRAPVAAGPAPATPAADTATATAATADAAAGNGRPADTDTGRAKAASPAPAAAAGNGRAAGEPAGMTGAER